MLLKSIIIIFIFNLTFAHCLERSFDFNFPIDYDVASLDKIKFYYEFVDKNLTSIQNENVYLNGQNAQIAFGYFKKLDIENDAVKKMYNQNLYSAINKTVYTVNKPIDFFSEFRLCNLGYLQQVAPSMNVFETSHCKFHSKGDFTTPSFDFELKYYNLLPDNLFEQWDKFLYQGRFPKIATFQINKNFGNVLGQKTADKSYILTLYYELSAQKTLVILYSLSYVINVPPKIFGGAGIFLKEYEKATEDGITRIRNFK